MGANSKQLLQPGETAYQQNTNLFNQTVKNLANETPGKPPKIHSNN
jgi:hypothetical protein